jgi:AcrR family transcriptional regulator
MPPSRSAALRRAPRARTRDPEAKRARVMAAARGLLVERGYAATTTAAVARRAGVSEGILFHHFGSKEGLLAAVAGEYGRGLAEAMFAGAPLGEAPPAAGEMLARAFDYVRERGTLSRLLVLAADPGSRETAHAANRAEIVGALARALAEWSARGLVRPMDPQIAAELLFALVGAALSECFVRGGGAREADYLREAVRCVEGAVAPRPDLCTTPETRSPS